MDYKYIEQLLERYWECATTLEEEQILRTFFSQKDVPVVLLPYKDLFTYTETEKTDTVLGDDFDARVLSMIEDPAPVKAKTIRLTQRLKPLFKAAAVVAIFLTLGNAMQVAFHRYGLRGADERRCLGGAAGGYCQAGFLQAADECPALQIEHFNAFSIIIKV